VGDENKRKCGEHKCIRCSRGEKVRGGNKCRGIPYLVVSSNVHVVVQTIVATVVFKSLDKSKQSNYLSKVDKLEETRKTMLPPCRNI
jgi:hypothetical protein